MKQTKRMETSTLVLGAILTALVILLQYVSMWIRFGAFSITLSLVPIVIGSIVCGYTMGAWLGLVFGTTVLLSGDANLFFSFNVPGTVITVLLKGTLCGLASGVAYKLSSKIFSKNNLEKYNFVRVLVSSVICPILNTGIFIAGCYIFFLPNISEMAAKEGIAGNIFGFIITAFVTFNFILELILNILLTPATAKILKATKRN